MVNIRILYTAFMCFAESTDVKSVLSETFDLKYFVIIHLLRRMSYLINEYNTIYH